MPAMLFDTSIYITALHMGDYAALGLRRIAGGAPVWLSSVVLEELHAGVSGAEDLRPLAPLPAHAPGPDGVDEEHGGD